MSRRPHSELANEEAFAMLQESVRQIQLKERVYYTQGILINCLIRY